MTVLGELLRRRLSAGIELRPSEGGLRPLDASKVFRPETVESRSDTLPIEFVEQKRVILDPLAHGIKFKCLFR
jgi:hypothetical protein